MTLKDKLECTNGTHLVFVLSMQAFKQVYALTSKNEYQMKTWIDKRWWLISNATKIVNLISGLAGQPRFTQRFLTLTDDVLLFWLL